MSQPRCILKIGRRVNDYYVLAYWPTNQYTPFVTWATNKGINEFFWGHYFPKRGPAEADFYKRIGKFAKGQTWHIVTITREFLEDLAPEPIMKKLTPDDIDAIAHDVRTTLEIDGLYDIIRDRIILHYNKYIKEDVS